MNVVVPAYLGFEGGAWVRLRGPVRAVLAYDERGQPHAFVVCEPTGGCCGVMTRPERRPALVGGRKCESLAVSG